ncbi:DUF397 domain-containing protein [Actinomadura sp. DSM 109109]|nr:DUF397 domain-containing protein [Actinomadura lepetitiana]
MDLSDLDWRKATKSGENGGACVEIASVRGVVVVRDSKDPAGPVVVIERAAFRRFVDTLR